MKKITKITVLVAAAALLGSGCLKASDRVGRQDSRSLTIKSATYETADSQTNGKLCSFKWTYPEIEGPESIVNTMNDAIALAVGLKTNYPRPSEKTVEEIGAEFVAGCLLEQNPARANALPVVQYVSERTYDVKWNQTPALSLLIRSYEYAGGAHGNPYMQAVNLDQNTGKQLLLGDLVKNESLRDFMKRVKEEFLFRYRDALFPEVTEEMKAFVEGEDARGDGTLAQEANFYLTSEGFVFYANVYDIAPYAAGALTVSIPYSEVKDLLRPENALTKIIE